MYTWSACYHACNITPTLICMNEPTNSIHVIGIWIWVPSTRVRFKGKDVKENEKQKNPLVTIHLDGIHICIQVIYKQFSRYVHVPQNQETALVTCIHMCIPTKGYEGVPQFFKFLGFSPELPSLPLLVTVFISVSLIN